ncbi:methionyl-tRNA formyltransferase [Thermus thermamylovorans]|uniref:Methionyl-tRNA formyltransferase n=1 Tax=Thermus thermamylovorans TaxID=2509362 RepID=A0A4Q9B043_9DEIN|nr:methionyl-tRNA formyltransferase [Thermus thermamylovorans]TBH17515.1 methionyl-tRNA formyltransferase [Thermus thermamylovorans]
MRVAFFGTPAWAVPVLDALNRRHQVVLVVTQPDRPKGRGLRPAPSPVAEYASAHGLPLRKPERLKGNREFLEAFEASAPQVAVTAAYGKILPKEVLEVPPWGFLNLHPSLLPKYRGPAPVQWALVRGERETGVAVMKTEEGLDTGPLYAVYRTEIGPDEDAVALSERLRDRGVELLLRVLEDLPRLTPIPQEGEPSYAPLLTREEGRIRFGESAQAIYNRHRGVQPWPGSYCFHEGKRVKVLRMRPEAGQGEPGVVLGVDREGVLVGTGEGLIRLLLVQPEGRRPMPAADWARGYGVGPGTRLE